MEWTVQDLGAIGEFVSAIAVIATLAYLAVQVRHTKSALEDNALVTRVTVMDQHTQAQSRWRGRLADSTELARIWSAARGGLDALDEADYVRFSQHCIDYFNIWRASFAGAAAIGYAGQSEHIVRGTVQMIETHQGMAELWDGAGGAYSALVVPEFTAAVERARNEFSDDAFTQQLRLTP